MNNINARLGEIGERVEKAMDGPWEAKWLEECQISPHVIAPARSGDGIYTICTPVHSAQPQMRNMEFIAHSRADIPYLLRLLKSALGVIEAAGEGCPQACNSSSSAHHATCATSQALSTFHQEAAK